MSDVVTQGTLPPPERAGKPRRSRARQTSASSAPPARTTVGPVLAEARRVLVLALPMVAAHLGNMTMGLVDTLIVGRLGTESLAAMALGQVWLWGTLMIANGVAMGVDPLI